MEKLDPIELHSQTDLAYWQVFHFLEMRLALFALLNAGALWLDNVSAQSQLPTVDLGYEVHQALTFNVCRIALPLVIPLLSRLIMTGVFKALYFH